jgi:hypothetical protein
MQWSHLITTEIASDINSFVLLSIVSVASADSTNPTNDSSSGASSIPIVLYHLYLTDIEILLWILSIFVSIFLLEFLYLERRPFDPDVESDA